MIAVNTNKVESAAIELCKTYFPNLFDRRKVHQALFVHHFFVFRILFERCETGIDCRFGQFVFKLRKENGRNIVILFHPPHYTIIHRPVHPLSRHSSQALQFPQFISLSRNAAASQAAFPLQFCTVLQKLSRRPRATSRAARAPYAPLRPSPAAERPSENRPS